MWEKETLLIREISPFPTMFSKDIVLQTCKNKGLSGKELTASIYFLYFLYLFPLSAMESIR